MDRAEFDSLAETLALSSRALETGKTILPGTLVASVAPPTTTPSSAGTLPRLELARPGGKPAPSAELELVSVLGRGGMGVVWAAHQRALDRTVAVKRLGEPPFAARDAAALLAEARATGALEHPAIVPVHDLGLDTDGSPLLVMKRVEGVTLGTLAETPEHPVWATLERRHGDRVGAVVEIVMRLCDALELAHQRGYVHRDVKCDNVMIGAHGEVYLLDWGVALRTAQATDEIEIVGTPSYLAPEMVRGDARFIDARSDVYLLGGTLLHALTGRPRHTGPTLQATLLAAFLSDPPPHADELPDELAALVRRATDASPDARPASAAALRDALALYLRHRGAERLVEQAVTSLERAGASRERAHLLDAATARALTEARFGLTQALRDWPENERARAALDDALALLAEVELARESPRAAAELARELRAERPELGQRIAAMSSQIAERESLAEAARSHALDVDPRRGGRARSILALSLVVGVVTLVGATALLDRSTPGGVVGYREGMFVDAAFVVALAVGTYAARRRLLVNRFSRHAVGIVAVGVVGSFVSHLLCHLRGDVVSEVGDTPTLVMFAATFATGALSLSRALAIPAAVAIVAALLTAGWPWLSLPASAVTIASASATLAWASRGESTGPAEG